DRLRLKRAAQRRQVELERRHEGGLGARTQGGVAVGKLGEIGGEAACRLRAGALALGGGVQERLRRASQRRDVLRVGGGGRARPSEPRIDCGGRGADGAKVFVLLRRDEALETAHARNLGKRGELLGDRGDIAGRYEELRRVDVEGRIFAQHQEGRHGLRIGRSQREGIE